MTKAQATTIMQITINSAIETLAGVHGVSVNVIGQAIARGDKKIMGQMADLIERMEQSL